jgi:EAL and modified HD-GYP domain-containing signal transduction protein
VNTVDRLVHLARQPILDGQGQLFGYELLYRGDASDTACLLQNGTATARVLTDPLHNMGLQAVTAGKLAFINVSSDILLGDLSSMLPRDGVVIELLETVAVTDEVVAMCKSLRAQGYALALDDFVPGSDAEKLLPYVKYVKLDVLALKAPELQAAARRFLPRGVRLLAEKVETAAVRDAAKAAGYTLFQGYFFCKPERLTARAFEANQVTQLKLLAQLNNPNATMTHVEDLIKRDGALSLRVLRCANSAAVASRSQVQSIREALMLIGFEQVRRWVSIWTMASLNGGAAEVVTTAVVRAKACELVGGAGPNYFLLGLCSLLDVMLGRPMPMALEVLPLDSGTKAALLGDANGVRRVLDAVTCYERADWAGVSTHASAGKFSIDDVANGYARALAWADELAAAA